MSAVRFLAGFELRRRWARVIGVAVLVGLVGGAVFGVLAGARRSSTALARFTAWSRSGDVALQPTFAYSPTPEQARKVGQLPDVAAFAEVRFYALFPTGGPSDDHPVAPLDSALGTVVDRARLVAGRFPDPADANAVTIGEALARQLHEGVGADLTYVSFAPKQLAAMTSGESAPSPAGPKVRLRIVGIVRRPDDLGDVSATNNVVLLTPAFSQVYGSRIGAFGSLFEIRTRHGASDAVRVVREARQIFAKSGGLTLTTSLNDTRGARSAINALTVALWILAGVTAVAGLLAIALILGREIMLVASASETLRSVGLTRVQRMLVNGPIVAVVALAGGAAATICAFALSPLFPVGVARRADPNVGWHLDWTVIALGGITLATFILIVSFVAALRTTAARPTHARRTTARRPSVSERAARAGAPPTVTQGLDLAFTRRHGSAVVPVRSAFVGAIVGVLGVTAVLVTANDLHHLAATPRLYGATWNFSTADTTFSADPHACDNRAAGLDHVTGVGAITALCYNQTELGGQPINAWGFTPIRGTIGPEIVAGRAPTTAEEIAIGAATLTTLHKHIGDVVAGRGPNGAVTYRIVGEAVFPIIDQPQPLADGAALTGAGLARIFESNNTANRYLLANYTRSANQSEVARTVAAIHTLGPVTDAQIPVEVNRVRHIDWLFTTLAIVFAILAALATGHALVTCIRRRRHDLAILRALGFDRRQTRATIAYQAIAYGAIALIIGIPTGIALGDLAWRNIANGLGVIHTSVLPILPVALVILTTILIANALAYLPGRNAANTRTTITLNTE